MSEKSKVVVGEKNANFLVLRPTTFLCTASASLHQKIVGPFEKVVGNQPQLQKICCFRKKCGFLWPWAVPLPSQKVGIFWSTSLKNTVILQRLRSCWQNFKRFLAAFWSRQEEGKKFCIFMPQKTLKEYSQNVCQVVIKKKNFSLQLSTVFSRTFGHVNKNYG